MVGSVLAFLPYVYVRLNVLCTNLYSVHTTVNSMYNYIPLYQNIKNVNFVYCPYFFFYMHMHKKYVLLCIKIHATMEWLGKTFLCVFALITSMYMQIRGKYIWNAQRQHGWHFPAMLLCKWCLSWIHFHQKWLFFVINQNRGLILNSQFCNVNVNDFHKTKIFQIFLMVL